MKMPEIWIWGKQKLIRDFSHDHKTLWTSFSSNLFLEIWNKFKHLINKFQDSNNNHFDDIFLFKPLTLKYVFQYFDNTKEALDWFLQ